MIKKFALALFVLVLGFVAYKQFKGDIVDWYVDNHVVRSTDTPATNAPDQVCLTVAADPRSGIAVQWRTAVAVKDGVVQYRPAAQPEAAPTEVSATTISIEDRQLGNDRVSARHSAVISGLQPDSAYVYRVGSKTTGTWSEWVEFKTAHADPGKDFSFIYMGDSQIGLDYWGKLLHKAYDRFPEAAFYIIAGDLVNNGSHRNEWDEFFAGGAGVFDRRPFIPVLGNHDYDGKSNPKLYLDLFTLPENGPDRITPECAYSFTYGNALFVVLDSNLPPSLQVPWLDKTLASSNATWKFVTYHHPAYSAKKNRDNPEVRKLWGQVFDKYHVDLALQGHDHAYLRTFPMRDQKRVNSPAEGTIYLVSVSGTKYYDQEPRDFTEVAFVNVSTYQTIDISHNPDKLTYTAYDNDGNVRDQFTIVKQ